MCIGNAAKPEALKILPRMPYQCITELKMCIEEVRWIEAGDAENELTEVHIVQTVQDSSRASVADADLEPAVDRVTAEEAFIGF
ncbi:hypothetical protein J6590_080483 [Homalodisca vitripennis]|nr:hypothetical protein J6590_102803 [Homalodisca vitripennis]KAG8309637.1 hypothetical protein J6590_080483 [Homalodisca vitripennis]